VAELFSFDVVALKDELRQFFADLLAAFTGKLQGQSGGVTSADLFAVPTTVITGETSVHLRTPEAVRTTLTNYIDRLRAMNIDRSVPEQSDLRILNEKACLLEVQWVRKDQTGAEVSRHRTLFVVAATSVGWRVVTTVIMGNPPAGMTATAIRGRTLSRAMSCPSDA
jgi:hypothetical protein